MVSTFACIGALWAPSSGTCWPAPGLSEIPGMSDLMARAEHFLQQACRLSTLATSSFLFRLRWDSLGRPWHVHSYFLACNYCCRPILTFWINTFAISHICVAAAFGRLAPKHCQFWRGQHGEVPQRKFVIFTFIYICAVARFFEFLIPRCISNG